MYSSGQKSLFLRRNIFIIIVETFFEIAGVNSEWFERNTSTYRESNLPRFLSKKVVESRTRQMNGDVDRFVSKIFHNEIFFIFFQEFYTETPSEIPPEIDIWMDFSNPAENPANIPSVIFARTPPDSLRGYFETSSVNSSLNFSQNNSGIFSENFSDQFSVNFSENSSRTFRDNRDNEDFPKNSPGFPLLQFLQWLPFR